MKYKTSYISLLVALSFSLAALASETELQANTPDEAARAAEAAKTLPAKYRDRPLLFVPMLSAPAKLTGDLKDPVWEKAATFKMTVTKTGAPAKFNTEVRLFCTADALYIGVNCEEPDPANAVVSNAFAWQNDSIELFVYPGASCAGGKLYYQSVVDANDKFEPYYTHLYPGKTLPGLHGEWAPKVEHAVVKGEKSWTLEECIALSDLKLTPEALAKKTPWRLDIFRNRVERGEVEAQSYCWAPTGDSGAYHMPGRFGYILPGAFVSSEWIGEFAKHANSKADDPPPPEMLREVKDLIGRLGHSEYVERSLAESDLSDRLSGSRTLIPIVKDLLTHALKSTPDSEVKLRAAKLLNCCSQLLTADDDAPPGG